MKTAIKVIIKILKGVIGVVFVLALFVLAFYIIMFVSEGDTDVTNFKDRISSDYRDLDFGRPPKDTYLSDIMGGAKLTSEYKVDGKEIKEDYYETYIEYISGIQDSLVYYETTEDRDKSIINNEKLRNKAISQVEKSIKDLNKVDKEFKTNIKRIKEDRELSATEEKIESTINDTTNKYIFETEELLVSLKDKNHNRFNEYATKLSKEHKLDVIVKED